jgi:ABC-type phosphate transport system substrate-binding protein
LNKNLKYLIAIAILAILAFSAAATMTANAQTWTSLIASNTLTIAGSSTVAPIATEESTSSTSYTDFQTYWNNLVATGTNWQTFDPSAANQAAAEAALNINSVSIAGLGSGTAVPALTGLTADIGEMSRPPSDGEWQSDTTLQQWAVGVDSVAIVVSPDMTWFPTSLTTAQVAQLFSDNSPSTTQQDYGVTGPTSAQTTPLYTNWGDFLEAYYGVSSYAAVTAINPAATSAVCNEAIQRAVRDPTSGTFDCFNNYFAKPNGYNFEYSQTITGTSLTTVVGSQEVAPYIYDEANINIFNTVSAGSLGTLSDAIGFISLGYLQSYGKSSTGVTQMIGVNISFNIAAPPSGQTTSPLIKYYGSSGTYAFVGSTANPPTWSTAVTPTQANVIYGYSGVKGTAATGAYYAWRWLWEVTPNQIPSTGPLLAAGVWIAYMMKDGTTNGGNGMFVTDQNYIPLSRADMAGGKPLDSNLNVLNQPGAPYNTTATQTQTIPDGKVNGNDFFYFVDAYISYYANGIYNPYADIYATGVINGNSFLGFVAAYIAYFTTYNPTG